MTNNAQRVRAQAMVNAIKLLHNYCKTNTDCEGCPIIQFCTKDGFVGYPSGWDVRMFETEEVEFELVEDDEDGRA